jgi:hypothetical protein
VWKVLIEWLCIWSFARQSQDDWTGTGFVEELASQEFPWQSCPLKIVVESKRATKESMSRREEIVGASAEDDLPVEVRDLLAELENDRGVQLALEVPAERAPARSTRAAHQVIQPDPQKGKTIISEAPRMSSSQSVAPSIVYRDSSDVRTILSLTFSMMIMAVLLVASGVGNVYQYLRRPDRIVVDGGSGRVLSINDRNYGREDGIELGPEQLTAQDKIYLTKEFVKAVYQVDPATRPRDMEKAFRMMVPDSAVKFSKWIKDHGILDQQKVESWQTVWNPMDVSVDKNDPYTVTVIGKQDITKVVGGVTLNEAKQLRLTLKLVADSTGRADRNLRSGFLVASFDYQELNDPTNKGAAQESGAKPSVANSGSITPVTALQNE